MDPMLLMVLAQMAPQFLKGLFGGGEETVDPRTGRALAENQRMVEQSQTALPSGYQSPMLGMADMFTMDNLTRMLDAYSGAGFPSGGGWGSPFSSEILKALAGQMPLLLAGVQGKAGAGRIRKKEPAKKSSSKSLAANEGASGYDEYNVPYSPPPRLRAAR